MDVQNKHRYDPLERLLTQEAIPQTMPEDRMRTVLIRAERQVGIKELLGLMLVNIWRVLAQVVAPLFVAINTGAGKSGHNNKGN